MTKCPEYKRRNCFFSPDTHGSHSVVLCRTLFLQQCQNRFENNETFDWLHNNIAGVWFVTLTDQFNFLEQQYTSAPAIAFVFEELSDASLFKMRASFQCDLLAENLGTLLMKERLVQGWLKSAQRMSQPERRHSFGEIDDYLLGRLRNAGRWDELPAGRADPA